MPIMYCNLAKSQASPLVFKVCSQPKCFKPLLRFRTHSFSDGFHPKPSESFNVVKLKILSNNEFCPRTIGNVRLGKPRNFSNGSPRKILEGDSGARTKKTLPWIASYKNREAKGSEKGLSEKSSRSSWEESANNFFLKNGLRAPVEDRVSKNRAVDVIEDHRSGSRERDESGVAEEKGEEIVDDPRWDKIKKRYRRINDEKPEIHRWNKQENWGKKTWQEATPSTVPKIIGEGVYGVGPVLAALTAGRREFYALYVQEGVNLSSNNRKKKDKKGFEKILKIANKIGLIAKEASKHDLNMVVDNRPHQGLVLDASPLEMVSIRELDSVSVEEEKSPLWVALDEVTDPQNLGAIIRSAYFFGAVGVVLCAKNSAPLSGVVSKASAGSLELMELRSCKNMMQFLSSSAENGWRVIGGSVSSRAVPLNEVPAGVPTILVLGSEGTGLRPLVERSCTELIRIPGNIPLDLCARAADDEKTEEVDDGFLADEFQSFMAVESLNVSVAAGVLLHHLVGSHNNSNKCHLGDKLANVLE